MTTLLICLGAVAALMLASYLAASAGAERWLPLREWLARTTCSHAQGVLVELRDIGSGLGVLEWGAPLAQSVYILRLGAVLQAPNVRVMQRPTIGRTTTMDYATRIYNRLAVAGSKARADCADIAAEADAEIAALRKDAERYRWLREGLMEFGVSDSDRCKCWWKVDLTPEEADAAIDKALAADASGAA